MDKYIEKIKQLVIEKTGMDVDDVRDDSYFQDDLNIGKIEFLEIVQELEEIFDLDLSEAFETKTQPATVTDDDDEEKLDEDDEEEIPVQSISDLAVIVAELAE